MGSPPATTLLVVALIAEALPLLKRLERARMLSPTLCAGLLAGQPVLLLRCGVGRRRAEQATARVMAEHTVGRVLSLGTCGALTDDLMVGALVTAQTILDASSDELDALTAHARSVVMATVPRVVDTADHRARWAARGAQVCEMEAAGVLSAAAGHPFHTLKVVSDLAGARAPRIRGLPRSLRVTAFQLRAYRLVDQRLAPTLEAWLRSAR